ncbi:MAG TPA: hypothetical protein VHY37_03810 [Tepidisphaeraceae bacterium]|jgi:hypothetical protein|nr:hypothetical protein [Tepidisphaeraceae bacterium]
MFTRQAAPDLPRLRREFLERAGGSFDQMFGVDGKNGLNTFAEREAHASEAGDELTLWLLQEHLNRDPAADPGKEVDCPFCAAKVPHESPDQAPMESRGIRTSRGTVDFDRAGRRCLKCRRVFFPTR